MCAWMNKIDWQYSDFTTLTPFAVYEILVLRQSIFIVEQKCAFLDADGYDLSAKHLLVRRDNKLIACARVLPPMVKYPEYSIGRLAVASDERKAGLGRAVMIEAIRRIVMSGGPVSIFLQAQEYLADTLYKPLGFERITDIYDEDGIPHVDMRLASASHQYLVSE